MRRSGYNSLNNSEDNEGGEDVLDFPLEAAEEEKTFTEIRLTDQKSNKKTFCLVFTLFFGGLITLVTSTLILLGHLDNELYADRMIPLMICGFLMFVPGAYYARIVYLTFIKRPGYSYDQIPSCY